jgi:hypothetical protein
MTAIDATFGAAALHRGRDPRQDFLWLLPWGFALVFGAGMGAWVLHACPVAAPAAFVARSGGDPAPAAARKVANPYGALVDRRFFHDPEAASASADSGLRGALEVVRARSAADSTRVAARTVANPYGALVDPGFFENVAPALRGPDSSAQASLGAARPAAGAPLGAPLVDVPLPPKRDVASVDDVAPLPPVRPAEFGSLASRAEPENRAPNADKAVGPTPAADEGNILQKLFGQGRPSGEAVAYAEPESRVAGGPRAGASAATDRAAGFPIFGKSGPPPGYDKWTAVYDISARTVYMPDGTKLEAHSGLGDLIDDPSHVSERMRGATPPHVYDLQPREELFHGVQALRMTPVGDGDIFGRAGILAHPYMLGPNGDSNGCVSVKDYDAFLKAYQDGQIKRLAVVAKLDQQ